MRLCCHINPTHICEFCGMTLCNDCIFTDFYNKAKQLFGIIGNECTPRKNRINALGHWFIAYHQRNRKGVYDY